MTHRDDIEGLRQLHDAEEKKETWKDYAKLNKEMDKEMAQLRKDTFNGTVGEHNLSLKMKYDLDKYFYNGEYTEAGTFYMIRNLIFYYVLFMAVVIISSIGSNEL
tara:strand:+ start:481 stop:795 length:315 start_codon:yes stop_codon:yes gene_type:complete